MKHQLILFLCLIFLAACKKKTPLDEVGGCQVNKQSTEYFVGKIDYQCVAYSRNSIILGLGDIKNYYYTTNYQPNPVSFATVGEIETMGIYFIYLTKTKTATETKRTEGDLYPLTVGKYSWGNGNNITPVGDIKEGVTIIRQIYGVPWLSTLKEQDKNSYFEVTKVEPYGSNDLLLVTGRFSCNLYHPFNRSYQAVRDAEFRAVFPNPNLPLKK